MQAGCIVGKLSVKILEIIRAHTGLSVGTRMTYRTLAASIPPTSDCAVAPCGHTSPYGRAWYGCGYGLRPPRHLVTGGQQVERFSWQARVNFSWPEIIGIALAHAANVATAEMQPHRHLAILTPLRGLGPRGAHRARTAEIQLGSAVRLNIGYYFGVIFHNFVSVFSVHRNRLVGCNFLLRDQFIRYF